MKVLTRGWESLAPFERRVLVAAVLGGLTLRVGFVLFSLDVPLAGDEPYYHEAALLQADEGKWFWGTAPYGIPHETLQKAPVYQTWVGLWYGLFGDGPDKVRLIQAVLSAVTIVLGWLLTRRLLGARAAAVAAVALAVHPNVWQFDVRLLSESLATPLTVLVLLVVLTREPTTRTAMVTGGLMGASLLLRPSAILLLAAVAAGFWAGAGLRTGSARLAMAAGICVLTVAPWTLRNLAVDPDHFVPISAQDQAAYGTFNAEAAGDEDLPYKWRPIPMRDVDILGGDRQLSDGALRAELQRRTREYISAHPESVREAFFWNGIVRLWDLRPMSQVVLDARLEERSRLLARAGLVAYWVILAFAMVGLVRLWQAQRRGLVLVVLATALAASVVYTSDSGTRYRAPLEPLVIVMACAALWPAAPRSHDLETVPI